MKILLVNTVALRGSIAGYIGTIADECRRRGFHTVTAARDADSSPGFIRIGGPLSTAVHGAATRLADRHGLASRHATAKFIRQAEAFSPDIVHLHNIHGYYLHYPTLFDWLRSSGRRVLWTLHDLWPLTGHCAFPDACRCRRHIGGMCSDCPASRDYPSSLFADRCRANIADKRRAFDGLNDLTILPVSQWAADELRGSILSQYPSHTIGIDIDTSTFRPDGTEPRRRVLGVANIWERRKNLGFFEELRKALPDDVEICIVGEIRGKAPQGITPLGLASTPEQMAAHYRSAAVFVNPTFADNFPLTNREAICCGTPVVSRRIGGCAEGLEADGVPFVAAYSDIELIDATVKMLGADSAARQRAARHGKALFDGKPNLMRLFDIYCGR